MEKRLLTSGTIVQGRRLEIWGWPVVVNFFLGGMAAGYSLLLFPLGTAAVQQQGGAPGMYNLLPAALASLGFLFLAAESSYPVRLLYAVRNAFHSWLSVEVITGGLFMGASVLAAFTSLGYIRAVIPAAAAGLVMSQGLMVYRSRGIPGWNMPLVPVHFLSSALSTGFGLLMVTWAVTGSMPGNHMVTAGLICLTVNIAVWLAYAGRPAHVFASTAAGLSSPGMRLVVIGAGHLFPLIILAWSLCSAGGPADRMAFLAAGCGVIFGGLVQKMGIILRANAPRGIGFGNPRR